MRGPDLIRVVTAPAILALVAGAQMIASGVELTPWKGAGFGMFASIDSTGTRRVRCLLVPREPAGGRQEIAALMPTGDKGSSGLMSALLASPSRQAAEELVKYLSTWQWRAVGEVALPVRRGDVAMFPTESTVEIKPSAMVIEVRRQVFRGGSAAPTVHYEPITKYRLSLD